MDFKPIAEGFCFLEAPRVDERGVWFSDCALGGVRCLRPDGRVDSWLTERISIGGMAINEDGALILSGPGPMVWLNPETGASGTFLDTLDGEPLSGVNDVMPDGAGGLYIGTLDHKAIEDGKPSGRSAIHRLAPDGRSTMLADGLKVCNGIGISPDGRKLYHNESMNGTIAYDIRPDSSLANAVMINDNPACDGLAVDMEGGVWITITHDGLLLRVMPDGRLDQRYEIPGGHVTSVCFGGPDWRDMYVVTSSEGAVEVVLKGGVPATATGKVFHARADAPGVPVEKTRFRLPRD